MEEKSWKVESLKIYPVELGGAFREADSTVSKDGKFPTKQK